MLGITVELYPRFWHMGAVMDSQRPPTTSPGIPRRRTATPNTNISSLGRRRRNLFHCFKRNSSNGEFFVKSGWRSRWNGGSQPGVSCQNANWPAGSLINLMKLDHDSVRGSVRCAREGRWTNERRPEVYGKTTASKIKLGWVHGWLCRKRVGQIDKAVGFLTYERPGGPPVTREHRLAFTWKQVFVVQLLRCSWGLFLSCFLLYSVL